MDSTSLVVTLKDQDNTALSSKSLDLSSLGFLTNTATGTNSLTILGTVSTYPGATNVGKLSTASSYSTAIGFGANAGGGSDSIAIGTGSTASGPYSKAIGDGATCSGAYSTQIGYGTNSEANSFYVSTSNSNNWKMLGSDGLIPDARLSSNIARTSDLPSIATTSTAGLVKPDGTTVTVDANGVISAQSGQQYAMVITDYTAS